LGDHVRQRGATHEERAVDVDPHDSPPSEVVGVESPGAQDHTGAVDQDVDTAGCVVCGRDRRVTETRVRDVTGFHPDCIHLLADYMGPFDVAVDDHH